MLTAFRKARGLVALVVAASVWLMAWPVSADSGRGNLELVGTTRDYLVVLRLGPGAEEFAPGATLNQIVFCGKPEGGVGSPEFARGLHHLEVHLLDRMTWRVVDTSAIAIQIQGKMDGLRQTVPPTKMADPNIGPADLHYGSNIFMPNGQYRVDVEAAGQPISFDFVVRNDEPEPLPSLWTVLFQRSVSTPFYLLFSLAAFSASALVAVGRWRPPTARVTQGFFAALIPFQGLHELEHVIQVVQVYLLDRPRAAGLFGSVFGVEVVHLSYNGWVLALMATVTAGYLVWHRRELAPSRLVVGLLVAGTAVQLYHVLEHVVRVGQFLQSGVDGTPGILGQVVDLVLLHFIFNTAAFAPFVIVFVMTGAYRPVAQELRGLVPAERFRPSGKVRRSTWRLP